MTREVYHQLRRDPEQALTSWHRTTFKQAAGTNMASAFRSCYWHRGHVGLAAAVLEMIGINTELYGISKRSSGRCGKGNMSFA